MAFYISIGQIVVAAIIIILILLQQRGTALGGAFGGEGGSFYSTRRGLEKKIFWATIVFSTLFVVLALASLLFR